MRRKTILLVSFLLLLYMIPPFVSATEYETSPESIASFGETLPDDVLYYPDGTFTNATETSATSGDDDYIDAESLDAVLWTGTLEGANFTFSDTVEGFTYHCYGREDFATGGSYLEYYNGSDWVILETFTNSSAWYNDTHSAFGNIISLRINSDVDAVIEVDFLSVSITYMTLASDGYAESFADVSDWNAINEAISTDGDVATITTSNDLVYDRYDCNTPSQSFEGDYFEFRFNPDQSHGSSGRFYFYLMTGDDYTGDAAQIIVFSGWVSGWQTHKYLITASETIECITILAKAVLNMVFEIDYLRIAPSNELGWQHDCSTVAGVTSSDGGSISTDGDNMTLSSDGDGSSFVFSIDTTTTASAFSTTYYPFLNFEINSLTESDGWRLWQYDGSNWVAVSTDEGFGWTTTTGTHIYNIQTLDSYVYDFRVNLTGTCTLVSDLMKAYSIANYTVTQSGTSVDDMLYVSSNVLNCEGTSFTSFVLDYDPALSVDTTRGTWTVTTSSGIPQVDFYIDAAWLGYTSDTSGSFPDGTLTDLRLKFTDSADVEAITFYTPIPQWNEAGVAELIFSVPYDYWALNMILIFGGLILMLVSVCIVAVKVRDRTITQDAGILLLFLFCVGWGLFIGGSLIG